MKIYKDWETAFFNHKNQYYMMYSLNKEIFQIGILDILQQESDEAQKQAQREKVIDAFFEYGKLKAIPTQLKKERVILEVIAEAFNFDRIYSEREVTIIIADFYDDFCTIRRDMISERLLGRNDREYWRIRNDG